MPRDPSTGRGTPVFYTPVKIEVDGRSPEDIAYHIGQLMLAGLITRAPQVGFHIGRVRRPGDPPDPPPYAVQLTWQGHEFLDAARNDTIWRRGKERVLKVAGGLTFDLLLAALKAEIRDHTGLDL